MTTRLLRHEYCENCGWEDKHAKRTARVIRPPTNPFFWHMKWKKDRGLVCPDCGEPLCNCIWCDISRWRREDDREPNWWRNRTKKL